MGRRHVNTLYVDTYLTDDFRIGVMFRGRGTHPFFDPAVHLPHDALDAEEACRRHVESNPDAMLFHVLGAAGIELDMHLREMGGLEARLARSEREGTAKTETSWGETRGDLLARERAVLAERVEGLRDAISQCREWSGHAGRHEAFSSVLARIERPDRRLAVPGMDIDPVSPIAEIVEGLRNSRTAGRVLVTELHHLGHQPLALRDLTSIPRDAWTRNEVAHEDVEHDDVIVTSAQSPVRLQLERIGRNAREIAANPSILVVTPSGTVSGRSAQLAPATFLAQAVESTFSPPMQSNGPGVR
jgi:hypothetical protein